MTGTIQLFSIMLPNEHWSSCFVWEEENGLNEVSNIHYCHSNNFAGRGSSACHFGACLYVALIGRPGRGDVVLMIAWWRRKKTDVLISLS